MERQYIRENNASRSRLIKLVEKVTDKELKLVIYKEGWTIAVALGHIAFWDERRALWFLEYRKNGFTPSNINELDTQIINDTLVPFLLGLPVRKAAELCLIYAENVDKVIEGLPPELIIKTEAMGDKFALDRSLHRKMHLDEIDVFLQAKRGG